MADTFQVRDFIGKKRDGGEHTPDELRAWLDAYLAGNVADYQMAAWLMAVFFRGMTPKETSEWTRLMWRSGTTLGRADTTQYWVDKHSTGGVGDKTSLLLVPLVTAVCRRVLGQGRVCIPMVSGRGLGHSGGTLDKLESVPGFSSDIPSAVALGLLQRNGFFMMGQTEDVSPADKQLYALRDVTATVESRPLIVSSILSKKLSENLDGLVLDVKYGEGAFMKTEGQARWLAESLVEVARSQGLEAVALFTRMDEPLGRAVGNLLEVIECEDFLAGRERDAGLAEVTLALASWMVHLASRKQLSLERAMAECRKELDGPAPLELFQSMFEAQGGSFRAYEQRRAKLADELRVHVCRATSDGFVSEIKALPVGTLVNFLGGGRNVKTDTIDPRVGVVFAKKVGDQVRAGDELATVYHRHESEEAAIARVLREAIQVGAEKPAVKPWVMGSTEKSA